MGAVAVVKRKIKIISRARSDPTLIAVEGHDRIESLIVNALRITDEFRKLVPSEDLSSDTTHAFTLLTGLLEEGIRECEIVRSALRVRLGLSPSPRARH